MVKVNGEPSFSQTFSQQFYVVFFVSPAKAHFQTQPFVGWFWQNVRQMLEFTKNYIRAFIRGSWIMNMQLYRDVQGIQHNIAIYKELDAWFYIEMMLELFRLAKSFAFTHESSMNYNHRWGMMGIVLSISYYNDRLWIFMDYYYAMHVLSTDLREGS